MVCPHCTTPLRWLRRVGLGCLTGPESLSLCPWMRHPNPQWVIGERCQYHRLVTFESIGPFEWVIKRWIWWGYPTIHVLNKHIGHLVIGFLYSVRWHMEDFLHQFPDSSGLQVEVWEALGVWEVKLTATVMGFFENAGTPIPNEHHFLKSKLSQLHFWDHLGYTMVYRFHDQGSCVPPLSVTGCQTFWAPGSCWDVCHARLEPKFGMGSLNGLGKAGTLW